MKKVLKLYLSCIFLSCFLFASQYESLLLIEFDNLDKNKKYDYLRHHLPDLIKNDSTINSQFLIEYAGKIEPFLTNSLLRYLALLKFPLWAIAMPPT